LNSLHFSIQTHYLTSKHLLLQLHRLVLSLAQFQYCLVQRRVYTTTQGSSQIHIDSHHCRLHLSHNSFLKAIEESPCHIISTVQTKEKYKCVKKQGEWSIQKIAGAPLQTLSIEYLFHTVLTLDQDHKIQVSKDRTSFYEENNDLILSNENVLLFTSWIKKENDEVLRVAS
jgi:hypothetical protein